MELSKHQLLFPVAYKFGGYTPFRQKSDTLAENLSEIWVGEASNMIKLGSKFTGMPLHVPVPTPSLDLISAIFQTTSSTEYPTILTSKTDSITHSHQTFHNNTSASGPDISLTEVSISYEKSLWNKWCYISVNQRRFRLSIFDSCNFITSQKIVFSLKPQLLQ